MLHVYNIEELKENIKDAVRCRFDVQPPPIIRLRMVKDEVMAV